jgi:putative hydrolase of the HAD superfamily
MDSAAPQRFKAIAFDVDGTLYDDAAMYLHTIGFTLRNPGLLRLSLALKKVRNSLRLEAPVADFYRAQAARTAGFLGMDAGAAHELIKSRIYDEWELSLKGLRLLPGLSDCLGALRSAGLKLGVLSDFPVGRKLDILGVRQYFSRAICTEELGCLKPHPAGFLKLAEELGESPADILYVGNSYPYDVLGAAGAGMKTAHYTRRPVAGGIADLSFHSYRQLGSWILRGSS